jgi:hypothetical protein
MFPGMQSFEMTGKVSSLPRGSDSLRRAGLNPKKERPPESIATGVVGICLFLCRLSPRLGIFPIERLFKIAFRSLARIITANLSSL